MPLPTSLDERFQQYDESPPMTAEEPPEDMDYDKRKPPKTPVTPPTDTPNISRLLVPPDDTTWRRAPRPPASPPKKRSASGGRNPLMRTRRRPARPVTRGGAGRKEGKKYVPVGRQSRPSTSRNSFRDVRDEAATAYASSASTARYDGIPTTKSTTAAMGTNRSERKGRAGVHRQRNTATARSSYNSVRSPCLR